MKPGDQFLWRSCNWKRVVVEIINDYKDGYYKVRCVEAIKEPYISFSRVWTSGEEYNITSRSLKTWQRISKSKSFNNLYQKLL